MKKKRRGWIRILIILIVLAAIGGGAQSGRDPERHDPEG